MKAFIESRCIHCGAKWTHPKEEVLYVCPACHQCGRQGNGHEPTDLDKLVERLGDEMHALIRDIAHAEDCGGRGAQAEAWIKRARAIQKHIEEGK
jgi:predicted  nucleic acid-binding Zn-ribbon protein